VSTDIALGTIVRSPLMDFLGVLLSDVRKVQCFESPSGIHGQAWTEGRNLHLLSVLATEPGTGQFRCFIEACKAEYDSVSVWVIFNPDLAGILRKYGFRRARKTESGGEVLTGYRWQRSEPCG